ncbi:MAG: putative transporter [Muribaculaceae bacterium]|nr:putative transporter [Muribaculaceae bacterium]
MEWIQSILFEHTAVQAVIVISVIIAIGLGLAKIHIYGISLGVTWVFFAGILAGSLGFSIDPGMLNFAESFGLILFIYELGLKVGPGFFSSFRQGGLSLNMLGLATVLMGTVTAMALGWIFNVPMSDMTGILSGATTNTPALGAAQQALKQLGISANDAALSCAVTYPFGVIGVIIAIILVRKIMVKPSDIALTDDSEDHNTFIATFKIKNPAVFGKSIKDLAHITPVKFVISRLWRDGNVGVPTSETGICKDDRVMVITRENDLEVLTVLFGELESRDWNTGDIDWNKIDSSLTSRKVVISKPELNGKKLGSLRLRNTYGINITRISRSGVTLLATPSLILQLGDRLTVVGKESQIDKVAQAVGNTALKLKDPNLAVIFVGIVLGLLVGSIPIAIPGISVPVKLGLAGGPIVVGILMGKFGPRFQMVTYTTRSANLMLRGIGLSLFLACLGLDSGTNFVETIMNGDGMKWVGLGIIVTLIPVLIMFVISLRCAKLDFGTASGMLCGAMANPMALNYANETIPGDNPSVAYATVYPIAMFSRVVIAQILILAFM